MNTPSINVDLGITPRGMLRSDDGLFSTGNGTGLIALTQAEFGEGAPGKLFFRKLFSDYIRKLAAFGEPPEEI